MNLNTRFPQREKKFYDDIGNTRSWIEMIIFSKFAYSTAISWLGFSNRMSIGQFCRVSACAVVWESTWLLIQLPKALARCTGWVSYTGSAFWLSQYSDRVPSLLYPHTLSVWLQHNVSSVHYFCLVICSLSYYPIPDYELMALPRIFEKSWELARSTWRNSSLGSVAHDDRTIM